MRRRHLVLITAGLMTAALAAGGAAAAAPPRPGQSGPHTTGSTAYWTPARRAHAIPRDVVLPSTRAKGGKPGKPAGRRRGRRWRHQRSRHRRHMDRRRQRREDHRQGVLQHGRPPTTSAPAPRSPGSANLVLTAGHCVWDDADGFATNWMFWPGYDNGNKPYGTWTASALFTTSGWHAAGNRDFPNDAGLAVVADGIGRHALRCARVSCRRWAARRTLPSRRSRPSATRRRRSTTAGPSPTARGRCDLGYYDGEDTVSMACDMTGGSSGGPWYQGARRPGRSRR